MSNTKIKKRDNLLFQPIKIGNLRLRNRIVRAATAERMADEKGRPGKLFMKLYKILTTGGAGMLITGHIAVESKGRTALDQTVISRENLRFFADMVSEVKKTDTDVPLIAQISHAGPLCSPEISKTAVTPWVPGKDERKKRKVLFRKSIRTGVKPIQATSDDFKTLAASFGRAALFAREAGFDGVQVHAAHGFLISRSLSPAMNRRDDEWGGRERDNRFRFLEQVLIRIIHDAGKDFPVLMKINCSDFSPGGLDPADSLYFSLKSIELGVVAIELSGGVPWSTKKRGAVMGQEKGEGYFAPWARTMKKVLSVPLILTGGIRTKEKMVHLLADGDADLIGLSRPLIREPGLPGLLEKNERDGSRCESCSDCLRERPTRCTGLPG